MNGISISIFVLFSIATTLTIAFCNGSANMVNKCIESEKQALLTFKQDLNDPSNRLASWNHHGGDCCKWVGVECSNITGHVLELHLQNPFNNYQQYLDQSNYSGYRSQFLAFEDSMLSGKINPSLLHLKHLVYLDLSGNNFVGKVPGQLGNLSHLRYLSVSNTIQGTLYVENLQWISNLSLLQYLDLGGVNLSKASDHWFSTINSLSSLSVLELSNCELDDFLPSAGCDSTFANFSTSLSRLNLSSNQFDVIPMWVFGLLNLVHLDLGFNNFRGSIPDGLQNMTFLKHLDLSHNSFNSSVPNWVFRSLSHLEHLDLSFNTLQGSISSGFANLTSLNFLDLSYNKLEGKIPRSIGKLCNLRLIRLRGIKLNQDVSEILRIFLGCVADSLEVLNFSYAQISGRLTEKIGMFRSLQRLHFPGNSIWGPIPHSIGQLSSLIILDISYNKLNGSSLSQSHLQNLTKLYAFGASETKLVFKINPDWIPPFQLAYLYLNSCYLGPQFPSWLHSQKSLLHLDIANSGISDTIPPTFWNLNLQYLNLSHNQIHGELPNLNEKNQLRLLDLRSNNLSGKLPLVSSTFVRLDLSSNFFSGSISKFLCYRMNESKSMQILNLEDNFLFGEIPDCWMNWKNLSILILDNNKFTGNLPVSLGVLTCLRSLHLRKNLLSGPVFGSIENCTQLVMLDVAENEFVENVPLWIGDRFSKMSILILRSNSFEGPLPMEICHLVSLQVLDLAYNNFSGTIPRCINGLEAMVTPNRNPGAAIQYGSNFTLGVSSNSTGLAHENAQLFIKGEVNDYNTILNLVRIIDLSKNSFSGEIPTELMNLSALQSLNLSHNFLTGRIPESIGALREIEVIDFSCNYLFGEIPQSILHLTYLNHLNLSNNNLSGKIPSSTQLQSFNASSFIGNDLCGPPLLKKCTKIVPMIDHVNPRGKEVDLWFVSIVLGFVVGFWSLIGPLIVNRRFRCAYYLFLDRVGENIRNVVRKYF